MRYSKLNCLFFICFYLSGGTFNYLAKVDFIRNVSFDEKIMLFEIYTVFLLIIDLDQEPLHSVSVSAVGFWEVSTFCWCVIYLCVLNAWSKRVVLHFWHLAVNKKCIFIYMLKCICWTGPPSMYTVIFQI